MWAATTIPSMILAWLSEPVGMTIHMLCTAIAVGVSALIMTARLIVIAVCITVIPCLAT